MTEEFDKFRVLEKEVLAWSTLQVADDGQDVRHEGDLHEAVQTLDQEAAGVRTVLE